MTDKIVTLDNVAGYFVKYNSKQYEFLVLLLLLYICR